MPVNKYGVGAVAVTERNIVIFLAPVPASLRQHSGRTDTPYFRITESDIKSRLFQARHLMSRIWIRSLSLRTQSKGVMCIADCLLLISSQRRAVVLIS